MDGRSDLVSQADAAALKDAVVTIGVFDGVHEGHRFLIETTIADALAHGRRSAIITFDRDPDEVFGVEGFRKLMDDAQRLETLRTLAADRVVVLPFSRELAGMEPLAFLDALFCAGAPRALHVGEGFRFGAQCAGDEATLRSWARVRETEIFCHPLLGFDGCPVSSTEIRTLLAKGCVERAAELLGRPYALDSSVEPGRREGRTMGIRTANLFVSDRLRAIGDGVYAAYATVDGRRYKAAVSVGVAPTFPEAKANIEAHLLDFDGDLYGKRIRLDFIAWLREMRVFASREELIETIGANIEWVRVNL